MSKTPQKFKNKEMQDRRSKELCMFCEEPYTPGHHLKHKRSQIYFLECEDDLSSDDDDKIIELPHHEPAKDTGEKDVSISVNVLSGTTSFNCMRVIGQFGKWKLHILIDPGSTHNFLDISIAKEIGCKLDAIKPMPVSAANGNNLFSSYKCSNFTWKVQGYGFISEIRTIPLDCCDLVLGVQWLSTLGPILWDFLNLRMEFTFNGIKHILRGVTRPNCKTIKGRSLNKLLIHGPQIALLQVNIIEDEQTYTLLEPEAMFSHIVTSGDTKSEDLALQKLLVSFDDLFTEPTELPLFREGFNHQIPLEAGSNPINQRPYRYSSLQKDVIDNNWSDIFK